MRRITADFEFQFQIRLRIGDIYLVSGPSPTAKHTHELVKLEHVNSAQLKCEIIATDDHTINVQQQHPYVWYGTAIFLEDGDSTIEKVEPLDIPLFAGYPILTPAYAEMLSELAFLEDV